MAQVKIREEKVLSNERYTLKEIHFDIQKKNGDWESQKREVYNHGNAVTVLLYNSESKRVILTKQFRIATFVNGNSGGMLLEACAGLLEEGEEPEKAVIREVEEETGYAIKELQKVCEAYSSPGAYTELVHFFIAPYTKDQKVAEGGGLEEEGEEVNVVEMPFEDALQMVEKGEIKDAKTILLLFYLKTKGLIQF